MAFFDSIFTTELADVAAATQPIDDLVVGSGTAGVTSALALAAAGRRVVLLEAGPFVMTEPRRLDAVPQPRGDRAADPREGALPHLVADP